MPYTVQSVGDRFVVTSPKGKKWKTTYASLEAADKAIAYIEGRYGGSPSAGTPMAATSPEEGYTPPEGERGSKTLMRLRTLQDEEAF